MEESQLQKLKEELQCSLCVSEYKDPRILPCHHTFCAECLKKFSESLQTNEPMPCPLCREHHPIPENGFPLNPIVNNLVMVLGLHKLTQPKQQAASPSVPVEAAASAPEEQKIQKKDNIVTAAACKAHKNKKTKVYCYTCQESICRDCTVKVHRDHNFDLIEEIFDREKEELTKHLEDLQPYIDKVNEAVGSISTTKTQIDEHCVVALKDIEKFEQELNEIIHTSAEQLKLTVEEKRVQQHSRLEEQEKQLISVFNNANQIVESVKALCSEGKGANEIMQLKKSFLESSKQLKQTVTDAVEQFTAGGPAKYTIAFQKEEGLRVRSGQIGFISDEKSRAAAKRKEEEKKEESRERNGDKEKTKTNGFGRSDRSNIYSSFGRPPSDKEDNHLKREAAWRRINGAKTASDGELAGEKTTQPTTKRFDSSPDSSPFNPPRSGFHSGKDDGSTKLRNEREKEPVEAAPKFGSSRETTDRSFTSKRPSDTRWPTDSDERREPLKRETNGEVRGRDGERREQNEGFGKPTSRDIDPPGYIYSSRDHTREDLESRPLKDPYHEREKARESEKIEKDKLLKAAAERRLSREPERHSKREDRSFRDEPRERERERESNNTSLSAWGDLSPIARSEPKEHNSRAKESSESKSYARSDKPKDEPDHYSSDERGSGRSRPSDRLPERSSSGPWPRPEVSDLWNPNAVSSRGREAKETRKEESRSSRRESDHHISSYSSRKESPPRSSHSSRSAWDEVKANPVPKESRGAPSSQSSSQGDSLKRGRDDSRDSVDVERTPPRPGSLTAKLAATSWDSYSDVNGVDRSRKERGPWVPPAALTALNYNVSGWHNESFS